MEEIEKIQEGRKEARYKMIAVSEYIDSEKFQHAKGREVRIAYNEIDKKVDVARESLDSINTKVATKINELEAELEKIERMYKIMDTHPQYMWRFYLAEEEK